MSIMSYNGSAIIAMVGKDCVAICSDLRFGVQHQTLATDFKKIFKINDECYVGLSGLGSDMQTLCDPPPNDFCVFLNSVKTSSN
eukprot:gene24077-29221_t